MQRKTLLDQEIDKVYEYLFKFAKTKAFDSGIRQTEAEAYLEGLKKAKRLINKQSKLK